MYLPLSWAWAQQTLAISGVVRVNNLPVSQVEVCLHPTKKIVKTDVEGKFSFSGLPPGNYIIHIESEDFHFYQQKINLVQQAWSGDIILEKNEATLYEVQVFGTRESAATLPSTILNRQFLEKNGAGTFGNSIEKIPGINTINTGGGISKPVLRGMSFNRIMVNDQGIKQEGQQWGTDHGLEIDPFNVNQVEIIKGPASLMYGGDGMGGVININTNVQPAKGFRVNFTSNYQSVSNLFGQTLGLEGADDKWMYSARGTFQSFGDYRVPADNFTYSGFVLPIYDQRLTNTAGREFHYSVMGGIKKSWGFSKITISQFNQKAGIFPGAVGIPNAYNLRHKGDNRNIDYPHQDNSHLKIISNSIIYLGLNKLLIDVAFQQNLRQEMSLPHAHNIGANPWGNLALGLNLKTYTANARLISEYDNRVTTTLGMQLQYMQNTYEGFEYLVPNFTTAQGGVFYFAEWRKTPNWLLMAGFRADAAAHNIEQHLQPIYINGEPTGEHVERTPPIERKLGNLSGSIGTQYIFDDHWKIRANAGSSFRMPTAIELGVNGIHHGNYRHELGNSGLKPERGYQMDVELTYNHHPFIISVSPFAAYYSNFIYLAPSGRFSPLPGASTMWQYTQNNAIFIGGELSTQATLFPGLAAGIGLDYVWNYNLETFLPLPLTPPFMGLINLEYTLNQPGKKLSRSYIFAETRLAGDQNRVDRNERTTLGYTLFEIGYGIEFKVKNTIFSIFGRAQNLTNAIYMNHLSRYRLLNLPEPGRNFSLSLKISI